MSARWSFRVELRRRAFQACIGSWNATTSSMLDLCAKGIPNAEMEDLATQCDLLAPMVTKFTMCFRKPLSKPSQCVLKKVSHSTQTSWSRRVNATVQQMQSPTETEDPVATAFKYATLPGQGSPDQKHPTSQCTNSTCSPQGKPTGKMLHKCSHCSKSFNFKYLLDMHLRTHTGERPFHCDYCNSKFLRKSYLKTHIMSHTGERPFHCDHCSSKFAVKSTLLDHIKTHTGERPYFCLYCQRRFTKKSDLAVHMRTHTGEKPYQCQLCPMAFSRNSSLLKHVITHKGGKPFHCDLCPKAFAGMHSLKKHKGKEH